MERQKFARDVGRQSAARGVKFVFGVTGDAILPFRDALAREGSIRHIGNWGLG